MLKKKLLLIVHILAVCVFVGSVPPHIMLGILADRATDIETFAFYIEAKYFLTVFLTGSAIVVALLSGILAGISREGRFRDRWLRLKVLLVGAIAINGAAVLTPLAKTMRDTVAAAVPDGLRPEAFESLAATESIAGAINIALIVIVVALAVLKPALRRDNREVA
jgi:hypothetical protein